MVTKYHFSTSRKTAIVVLLSEDFFYVFSFKRFPSIFFYLFIWMNYSPHDFTKKWLSNFQLNHNHFLNFFCVCENMWWAVHLFRIWTCENCTYPVFDIGRGRPIKFFEPPVEMVVKEYYFNLDLEDDVEIVNENGEEEYLSD